MIRMTTKRKAGRIVYQATSFRKAIYALFLAFFLWGMVVTMGDPEATGSFAVPIACSLLCFFGLLYREGWVFDPQKKTVVSLSQQRMEKCRTLSMRPTKSVMPMQKLSKRSRRLSRAIKSPHSTSANVKKITGRRPKKNVNVSGIILPKKGPSQLPSDPL